MAKGKGQKGNRPGGEGAARQSRPPQPGRGAGQPARRPSGRRQQAGGKGTVVMVALVALAAVLAFAAYSALKPAQTVASEAPGFTLPDQDGKQVSLESFKGKPVALVFFRTFG